MPQESTYAKRWWDCAIDLKTASAMGERQMLPRQTKSTETGPLAFLAVMTLSGDNSNLEMFHAEVWGVDFEADILKDGGLASQSLAVDKL